MTKEEFLKNIKSPLPNAILKKWPNGNIMQFWAENPELYSKYFGQFDDVHRFVAGHTGIDIATSHRDPVYAAHDGKIEGLSNVKTGTGGLMVFVWSPMLEGNIKIVSGYAHLDEIVVSLGQEVKQGDLLGYEGSTGFVLAGGTPYWGNAPAGIGTHLHFMFYENVLVNGAWVGKKSPMGNTFDPLPWLTGDWSGTMILLENVKRFLFHALEILKGRV